MPKMMKTRHFFSCIDFTSCVEHKVKVSWKLPVVTNLGSKYADERDKPVRYMVAEKATLQLLIARSLFAYRISYSRGA